MKITRHHARIAPCLAAIVVGITLLTSCSSDDTATVSDTYTINAGDTLSDVAGRAGVSLTDLVAANGWSDGSDHLIIPGDVIKLPQGTSAASTVTTRSAGTGSASASPSDDTSAAGAGTGSDTTYLDLFFNQGILYNPFSPDAVGGDIGFLEPACNNAVTDLAAFGAARGGVNAAAVLASLKAVNGDLPSNFPAGLNSWQAFIADHSATYSGPFLPVSQGKLDNATLQRVLIDPAVVDMLDDYTSLELKVPGDFIDHLIRTCTSVEV